MEQFAVLAQVIVQRLGITSSTPVIFAWWTLLTFKNLNNFVGFVSLLVATKKTREKLKFYFAILKGFGT
jgi:hypothetical protein